MSKHDQPKFRKNQPTLRFIYATPFSPRIIESFLGILLNSRGINIWLVATQILKYQYINYNDKLIYSTLYLLASFE